MYGPVPPIAETVALPVFAAKQDTFVCVDTLVASAADGWVIVTFRVLEHPRASVTMHVHVPACSAFADALLCTGVVFQLKVYGAVPPLAVIVALPVLAPKQVTLVWALRELVNTVAGCVIGTLRVVEHPLLSVTVQVHVPAVRPVAVTPFCGGVVFQLKV